MSECPGYKTSGLCSCCEGPGHVVHCSGCSAHGGDRLTPEERADFEAWRAFIHRFADMGDHQDLRMCAIIDRLAPKPNT